MAEKFPTTIEVDPELVLLLKKKENNSKRSKRPIKPPEKIKLSPLNYSVLSYFAGHMVHVPTFISSSQAKGRCLISEENILQRKINSYVPVQNQVLPVGSVPH